MTSAFCAEAIARISPVPVVKFTYPVTLATEAIRPDRAHFGIPTSAFAFVFSFDFHSFVERKNPFAVARAFKKAFGERKDVVLVFKSINGDQYPEQLAEMREAAAGCSVVVLDGYFSRDETLSLFASCDALVSLHRAEGLGLGMAEAMALGKPVVATAYSGNMDFMDVNNSLPVRYELVPLKESYGPYLKGNLWAEPDVEHAAQQLRYLVDNPTEATAIGARAARHIREKHNPTVTAKQITTRLKRLGLWQG